MKYSFVIPMYNSEKYITETVCSILNQTYSDFEVIIVNDGSTDNSYSICKEIADNDKRVKLYNNTNNGVAYSRNYGIKNALGDYIIFLDSDDYWNDSNALQEIDDINKDKDLILFGYNNLANNEIIEKTNFNILTSDDLEECVDKEVFTSSCCLKAIRRELLIKNELYFIENYYVEDIEWNLRLAINTKDFSLYKKNIYVYRQSNDSRSHTISKKMLTDYYDTIEKSIKYINDSNRDDLWGYISYNYLILCARSYKSELQQKLKNFVWLLDKSNNKKVKLARFAKKTIGFNLTCFLLNKYIMEK